MKKDYIDEDSIGIKKNTIKRLSISLMIPILSITWFFMFIIQIIYMLTLNIRGSVEYTKEIKTIWLFNRNLIYNTIMIIILSIITLLMFFIAREISNKTSDLRKNYRIIKKLYILAFLIIFLEGITFTILDRYIWNHKYINIKKYEITDRFLWIVLMILLVVFVINFIKTKSTYKEIIVYDMKKHTNQKEKKSFINIFVPILIFIIGIVIVIGYYNSELEDNLLNFSVSNVKIQEGDYYELMIKVNEDGLYYFDTDDLSVKQMVNTFGDNTKCSLEIYNKETGEKVSNSTEKKKIKIVLDKGTYLLRFYNIGEKEVFYTEDRLKYEKKPIGYDEDIFIINMTINN